MSISSTSNVTEKRDIRELPILFSAPMVRALLAGTKTQTRRIVKLPHMNPLGQWEPGTMGGPAMRKRDGSTVPMHPVLGHSRTGDCIGPTWWTGDCLWVREAWRTTGDGGRCNDMPPRDLQAHQVWYEADGAAPAAECVGKLRPSMFMPRWASRILLEVNKVRVQRLQEISEADCWAEGIEEVMHDIDDLSQCLAAKRIGACIDDAKPLYMQLWERINGAGSWDANPWVWAVSFRACNGVKGDMNV